MKKMMLLLTALSFMVFVGTASALPYLTGEISFIGVANLTGSTDFVTSTGVDFVSASVGVADGSFAGLVGQAATFEDFEFDPFNGPFAPFWTVGNYTFDLDSLLDVSRTVENNSDFLTINGSGLLKAPGFEDTTGTWNLTTQSSNNSVSVTFSSSATAVPEPGTLLLLGSGLAGLALYRRRSMNK